MSSQNDIAIRVENLSKAYKLYNKPVDRMKESLHPLRKKYHHDFYALNDVSFEVKKGETIGIIGKNGSGKSTLLKILTGVLTPTSGSVQVNGKVSALLELGAGFNPEFTGVENVYFNGSIMGYTRAEMDVKLDDILSFADIGEFAYQPVKTYSSGMYVRLAFALSINVDPDILIVDEALSVGDVRFQKKCFSKFEKFKENGKTILFVTHAIDLVKTYCGSAIFLNDGIVKEMGTPKGVVDSYLRSMRDMDETSVTSDERKSIKSIEQDHSLTRFEELSYYNQNECRYGSGDVLLENVSLIDAYGVSTNFFEIGSHLEIKVDLLAQKNLESVIFGFGIRNVQGQDLIVFNGIKEYDNFSINKLEEGHHYQIKIKTVINLVPNDYMISFSLVCKEDEDLVIADIRYDALIIKVIGKKRLYAGQFVQNHIVEMVQVL